MSSSSSSSTVSALPSSSFLSLVLPSGWGETLVCASAAAVTVLLVDACYRRWSQRHQSPAHTQEQSRTVHTFTLKQLAEYNGQNNQPIYVSLCGMIYDVSTKPQHYGPQGAYSSLAGKDISRALALMDLHDFGTDLSDLTEAHLEVLRNWEKKFQAEYPLVGVLSYVAAQAAEELTDKQQKPPSQPADQKKNN